MIWGVVAAWLLWAVVALLFCVLWIRVDPHDWGMVGLTGVVGAALVLLTRSLLLSYGVSLYADASVLLWRLLVLVFGPLALVGFAAGLLRDPPPPGHVARRAVLLAVALAALYILLALARRAT